MIIVTILTKEHKKTLQCFDTIDFAPGWVSSPEYLSDEVLAWSSVWSKPQVIIEHIIELMLLPLRHFFASLKSRLVLTLHCW